MSSCDPSLSFPIAPIFTPKDAPQEAAESQRIISTLNMLPHMEGGYFVETDRDPLEVPNPFLDKKKGYADSKDQMRSASSSIFYYLSQQRPQGFFHRNLARTVHTLHKGRGRYVIIHADEVEPGQKARVETFVVGQDIEKGEKLQWVVEGGKYKASFLLPDKDSSASGGLLISEVVVPGFSYDDHSWLEGRILPELVTSEQAQELKWLVRAEEA